MLLHAPLQAREEAPQEAIRPKARVSQRASTSRGRLAELGREGPHKQGVFPFHCTNPQALPRPGEHFIGSISFKTASSGTECLLQEVIGRSHETSICLLKGSRRPQPPGPGFN